MEKAKQFYHQGKLHAVIEYVDSLPKPRTPGVLFYAAGAALYSGKLIVGKEFLDEGFAQADGSIKGDLECLLGYWHRQMGNQAEYKRLVQHAAQTYPTAFTLYHLAFTLLPREGINVLKEALFLAEQQGNIYLESSIAHGTANLLRNMGQYRQAFSYAQYAEQKLPDPGNKIMRADLAFLIGELEGLEDELLQLLGSNVGAEKPYRSQILDSLGELYLVTKRPEKALQTYNQLILEVPRESSLFHVRGAVRALVAQGMTQKARKVAFSGSVSADFSDVHKGIALSTQGLAYYPTAQAEGLFLEAYHLLREQKATVAAEAIFHLAGLYIAQGDIGKAQEFLLQNKSLWQELGDKALSLLAGQAFPVVSQFLNSPYRLYVLGKTELFGPKGKISLRPKGFAILFALLNKKTLSSEELCEAVYNDYNPSALKVEISRLRDALGDAIRSRPYRLEINLWSDFIELRKLLHSGQFKEAIGLYRGPLLANLDLLFVNESRQQLENELRISTMEAGSLEDIFDLAQIFQEDLEVWEKLQHLLVSEDPRRGVISSRVSRLKKEYENPT